MENEQPNAGDTQGKEADKVLAADDKPISEYDKALELVKRREEASKFESEILAKKEKLAADKLISGTGGGHVEVKPPAEETPKEYRERIEKEISEGKHDD